MDKALDAALVWFRRDLRVADHAALYHALKAARQVWCAFVFDRAILDALPRADRRVEFIVQSVDALAADLAPARRALRRRRRAPARPPRRPAPTRSSRSPPSCTSQAVFANHDDDPYALARDAARARRARRPRRRPAHVEGPRDLRAQRGADRERQAVHASSRRTGAPGWRSSTTSSSSRTRSSATPPRSRRAPAGVDAALPDAGARSASSRPTSTRSRSHGGSAAARGAARRLPRAASTTTRRRATTRR